MFINLQWTVNYSEQLFPLYFIKFSLFQNFKLSFQFPYYGHLLDQVVLTTSGKKTTILKEALTNTSLHP